MKLLGREVKMKPEAVVITIAVLMLLGCLIGYLFFRDKSEIIIEAAKNGIEETREESGTNRENADVGNSTDGVDIAADATKIAETIKIYVVGCVKEPGIVTIQKGQLIHDAIAQAGGLTEEADADNINMVYKLNENVMLYIKSTEETEQKTTAKAVQNAPVKAAQKAEPVKGNDAIIVVESGESAVIIGEGDNGSGVGGQAENKIKPVNINTATIDELDTLPGIGEATAKDIIAFREKNEGFKKIEDIMRVPRIKENRFESLKDYITVD